MSIEAVSTAQKAHANPEMSEFTSECLTTDFICLSHLRWDFVYQRPQHLMSRFAKNRRVFFVEEPIFSDGAKPEMKVSKREDSLHVAVPHLPHGLSHEEVVQFQKDLLDTLIEDEGIEDFTVWYYTPMALQFSRHLKPSRVIFDAMDELSAFKGAPRELLDLEAELMARADHVFTGGQSLYEAKKHRHSSVHAFPSSIDRDHFMKARKDVEDPADQAHIPHPRVGFYGVVDERFDIELLRESARIRPDWHFIVVGPVVKIDPADLPKASNIHYLGMKKYAELPQYLAHWDLAMLPFALNESTKFISPTKTPEYLAAGKPVVSTPIRDVIRPYGEEGMVRIAETAEDFCTAGDEAMSERATDPLWLARVDRFLAANSWDETWKGMAELEKQIDCFSIAAIDAKPTSSLH